MNIRFDFWPTLSFVFVMLSWIVFALTFVFLKKPPSPPDKKRDPSSFVGIALQGVSYLVVWSVRRVWFTPMFAAGRSLEIALAVAAMLLAAASVWFCALSIRVLGQQWSLTARVLEGHKLVTEGPYSVVRNPIYTGMFGMLLATGLAVSHWIGLVLAIMVFGVGTVIRIRSEEKLLHEAFGPSFEEYAHKVPAVIPFLI